LTSIGTLNEGSVHQALKARYAICGSDTEYEIDGFVVDIVLDGRIIEIQTSGFSTLKRKLPHLLERYRVTLVHPIAQNRYIVKVPDDPDQATTRRRSPKHGSLYDVFAELVSIPALMEHPNMTLEVVLTQEDEIRVRDDQRGWRRGGWVVAGRRLLDITETHTIASMGELFERVDGNLPDEFTTNDLAAALASPLQLGQQAAYCFRHAGITDICGKTGNSLLYRRSTTAVG
jgi:hypothetical protein|tara:strand:+ start:1834 stop:2526 length:693 start_codon:yes stop_codon:yes gene_type:complete